MKIKLIFKILHGYLNVLLGKIFLAALITSQLSIAAAYAQTEEWYGAYTYEASLGENAAEDQMIIQYSFILTKDKCLVASQGYQTDEKIICTTETKGKDLLVKFKHFDNGSTENIYGAEAYEVDSILFKLTSTDKTLLTTWGSLAPDDPLTAGKYFVKTQQPNK